MNLYFYRFFRFSSPNDVFSQNGAFKKLCILERFIGSEPNNSNRLPNYLLRRTALFNDRIAQDSRKPICILLGRNYEHIDRCDIVRTLKEE